MRLYTVGSSRPAFYDRNASSANSQSSQNLGIAPHANTQRWTYTVPSLRNANLDYFMIFHRRVTVAAPAGACHLALGGGVGGSSSPTWGYLDTAQNVADFTAFQNSGQAAFIASGGVVNFSDGDLSTGGTCTFLSFLKLTEYDA